MSKNNESAASGTGRRRMGRAASSIVTTAIATAALAAGAYAPGSAAPLSGSTDPVASAGCAARAATPGESTQSYAVAGKSATYIQDVPARPAAAPVPVVFDLHGYLETVQMHHQESQLGAFGATHGFVTITPQLDESGSPRWDFGPHSADVAYLGRLLTHVQDTLCVDRRRAYVTGLSMGAFTTSSIACQLADRFAAAAPVAGLQDFTWCRPARHIPILAFHGTADPFVAYTGGSGPNAKLLPAPDGSGRLIGQTDPNAADGPGKLPIPRQAAAWAARNGCAATPAPRQISADVVATVYSCAPDSTVELYTVRDGGHTWPGSTTEPAPEFMVGKTTMSVNADQVMWDFFQAHPLSGSPRS